MLAIQNTLRGDSILIKSQSRRGFTMVELLMVIATIGVMSMVAIPKFLDYRQEAKVATAAQAAMNLSRAVVGKRITMLNKCGVGLAEWESQVTEKLQEINANDARVAGRCTDAELGELSYRLMDSASLSLFDYMELGQTEVVACLCADADSADCFDMNYNYCLWGDEIRIAPNADQVLVAMRTGGGSGGDSGSDGSSGDDGSTGDEGGTSGDESGDSGDSGDSECTPSYAMDEGLSLCQEQCSGEYVDLELCSGGDESSGDSGDSGSGPFVLNCEYTGDTYYISGTCGELTGPGSYTVAEVNNINDPAGSNVLSGISCEAGAFSGNYTLNANGGPALVGVLNGTQDFVATVSCTGTGDSGDSGDSGGGVLSASCNVLSYDEMMSKYNVEITGSCEDGTSVYLNGSDYSGVACSGGSYTYNAQLTLPDTTYVKLTPGSPSYGEELIVDVSCGNGDMGDSGESGDSGDSGSPVHTISSCSFDEGAPGEYTLSLSGTCPDDASDLSAAFGSQYINWIDCSGGVYSYSGSVSSPEYNITVNANATDVHGACSVNNSSGDGSDSGDTACVSDNNFVFNGSYTVQNTYYCHESVSDNCGNSNVGVEVDCSFCGNCVDSGSSGDPGGSTGDVPGCMDAGANNYNPSATIDDGSCTYDVSGCTDPGAENYNPSANVDDGSCTYGSSSGDSGDSGMSGDSSSGGDVYGCTDPGAENYNPSANVDDGSCTYGSSSGDSGDSGTTGDSGSGDSGSCGTETVSWSDGAYYSVCACARWTECYGSVEIGTGECEAIHGPCPY